MKQTKKLTRSQREFLQRKKIDTSDLRLVDETPTELILQKSNGEIISVKK